MKTVLEKTRIYIFLYIVLIKFKAESNDVILQTKN